MGKKQPAEPSKSFYGTHVKCVRVGVCAFYLCPTCCWKRRWKTIPTVHNNKSNDGVAPSEIENGRLNGLWGFPCRPNWSGGGRGAEGWQVVKDARRGRLPLHLSHSHSLSHTHTHSVWKPGAELITDNARYRFAGRVTERGWYKGWRRDGLGWNRGGTSGEQCACALCDRKQVLLPAELK